MLHDTEDPTTLEHVSQYVGQSYPNLNRLFLGAKGVVAVFEATNNFLAVTRKFSQNFTTSLRNSTNNKINGFFKVQNTADTFYFWIGVERWYFNPVTNLAVRYDVIISGTAT